MTLVVLVNTGSVSHTPLTVTTGENAEGERSVLFSGLLLTVGFTDHVWWWWGGGGGVSNNSSSFFLP